MKKPVTLLELFERELKPAMIWYVYSLKSLRHIPLDEFLIKWDKYLKEEK